MQIWAHTLVKNEERYVWFAVMSVIDYVDRILVWDTGSTDKTVQIIDKIKKKFPEKVDVKYLSKVNPHEFTQVRQQMLRQTKSDWFIMVDGDEIWWDDSIKETIRLIHKKADNLESVVNRYYNVIGDISHYQEEKAGRYEIDGEVGHLTIRAIKRKIPGLHFGLPHGKQGIFDGSNTLIQERQRSKREFINEYAFLHFTHMLRSKNRKKDTDVPKREMKFKHELGIDFPLDFYYPEVLFREKPAIVPSPWTRMNFGFWLRSLALTLPRKVKRRLIKGKSGY